ncbi:hypothetical protein BZK31_13325 [Pseudomonas floridensis]|uniref:Uncharacterized protein n=1 Tax=Pseudomonas floridensis TaxID=1958950 RepID=A0A1X0N5P1_9PSED|nr:hypothetical protein BZK31_13325 [Pseudomonas floridensis]
MAKQQSVVGAETIPSGEHVGIELVERCDELIYHAFLSVAFVVEDCYQSCSAVQLPEWAFGGAEPDFGEMVDDDVADEPAY